MNEDRWIRKTVIVGLGGTGRDVVLNIKRKYREVYGTEDVPATRFLVFDTADPKPLPMSGGEPIELSPGEFCKLSVANPALAKRMNEEIRAWFPEHQIPMMSINRGASQFRALGRLALYSNAREVYSRIKRAIDGVNSILPHEDLKQFRITGDSVLVNVVSSLSGGTGSGTFLDVAYVCREHMRSATDTLTAYLLLPDVFTSLTATDNVEANAYAALSELDWLASRATFDRKEETFDFGGRKLSMQQRPFDTMYLVNNRNQRGQVYETVEEVTELIGLGIFVATGAPGKEALDVWDNLQHQVGPPIEGKQPMYASFGVSELALDLAGHAIRETRELATETLHLTFLGEPPADADDADEFLREHEVGLDLPARLLDGALVPVNGNEVQPDALSAFVNAARQEALARVEAMVREQPVPERYTAHLLSTLDLRVTELLRKTKGVPRAFQFVNALISSIDALQDQFTRDVAEHRANMESARRGTEAAQARAQKALKAWLGRRTKAGSVARQAAAAATSEATGLFLLKRKERAIEALGDLRKAARRHQELLATLRELALAVSDAITPDEPVDIPPEPFTIRLPCPKPKRSTVSLDAGSFVAWLEDNRKSMAELAALSQTQFRALLLEFAAAQPGVKQVTGVTVGEALAALPESEQRRYLQDMDTLASPLWEYEPAYLPAGRRTQTIQILGIPNGETDLKKLLPTLQTGRTAQLVMTNDPQRIYCYKVEAAIPAFMLSGAHRYKARYDAMRDSVNFHSGRGFEDAEEFVPDDDFPTDRPLQKRKVGPLEAKVVSPNGGGPARHGPPVPQAHGEPAADGDVPPVPGGEPDEETTPIESTQESGK